MVKQVFCKLCCWWTDQMLNLICWLPVATRQAKLKSFRVSISLLKWPY